MSYFTSKISEVRSALKGMVPDRLRSLLRSLITSFLFVPLLVAGGIVLVTIAAVTIDLLFAPDLYEHIPDAVEASASSTRTVFATIAGAVITMTSLSLSLTVIALQLASAQFGPRIMHAFFEDVLTQVVLGLFVGTFLCSLVILTTVRGADGDGAAVFAPLVSYVFGMLLAIASLIGLIVMLHHVAHSIQAENIIDRIAVSLDSTIDHSFPTEPCPDPGAPPAGDARPIGAARHGYIVLIDRTEVLQVATEHRLIVRLVRSAGDFVDEGDVVLTVEPAEQVDDEIAACLCGAVVLGKQRTPSQDQAFAVDQLVDIALRALSPGINDPGTACVCIDRLGLALRRVARAHRAPTSLAAPDGVARLVVRPAQFDEIFRAAFDPVREYGLADANVTERLVEAVRLIATDAHRPSDLGQLRRFLADLGAGFAARNPSAGDAARVRGRIRDAMIAIEKASGPLPTGVQG